MKRLVACWIILLACGALWAVEPTKNLDPQLSKLFAEIQARGETSKIKGKEFEAQLTLKYANEKFLIFEDAYIQQDAESRYQLGKWQFEPELVEGLGQHRGEEVKVRFRIEKIHTEPPYSDMPFFDAKILSIELIE